MNFEEMRAELEANRRLVRENNAALYNCREALAHLIAELRSVLSELPKLAGQGIEAMCQEAEAKAKASEVRR